MTALRVLDSRIAIRIVMAICFVLMASVVAGVVHG
jgi:hypothetical protein